MRIGSNEKGRAMNYQLRQGSAHSTDLPDASVHCVITSPPYFGLRSYDGDQSVEWPAVEYAPMPGLPIYAETAAYEWHSMHQALHSQFSESEIESICTAFFTARQIGIEEPYQVRVPAMTCGLGEEPTPEAYIGHLVLVMREMWRVLRDDGTAWVNLGDSYASSGKETGGASAKQLSNAGSFHDAISLSCGVPYKSKILIPHRFALAMQAEGWIVRQDIVWAKGISCLPDYAGSCMPESVQDRPTNGHEYVFLLAKQGRYSYDAEAVKEGYSDKTEWTYSQPDKAARAGITTNGTGATSLRVQGFSGRNLRSVWALNPGSYPGAHFATFPERLPELMVLAGTSAKGVCPECGAPWERVVERKSTPNQSPGYTRDSGRNDADRPGGYITVTNEIGWRPTCDCDAGAPMPATVLDPFNGAGTTGLVAMRHNRDYIGIDMSDAYFEQTRQRFSTLQPMLPGVLA